MLTHAMLTQCLHPNCPTPATRGGSMYCPRHSGLVSLTLPDATWRDLAALLKSSKAPNADLLTSALADAWDAQK